MNRMVRKMKKELRKQGVKFFKEKNGNIVTIKGYDEKGNEVYSETRKQTKFEFHYNINIDLPGFKVIKQK